ncbi:unnamed protein product [Trichobilharzia szidati]|nr:unnamed protein product [Trichobilharzia szidati]
MTTNQLNVDYDSKTEECGRISQDRPVPNSPVNETNTQQKCCTKDENVDYTILDRYLAKIHSNMDSRYPPPGIQYLDSRKPSSLFPSKMTFPLNNTDKNNEMIEGNKNVGFDFTKIYQKHDWNIPLTPSLQITLTQNFCAYFYYRYCNSMGDTVTENVKSQEKPLSSSSSAAAAQVEKTHQRRRRKSSEHIQRNISSPTMQLSCSSSSSSSVSSAASISSSSMSSLSSPSHLSASVHQHSVRNRKYKHSDKKRKHRFQRSNLCPFFFVGSLSSAIKLSERPNGRPWPVVLLYLHHEESPYTQEFVTKILCSTNDDTLKQHTREHEEEEEAVQERSFDYHHSYKHHRHHQQQQQQRHQHQGKGDKQNLHRKEHFNIDNDDDENAENVAEEKMSTGLNDALSDKLNDFNNDVILPQLSNSSLITCESNVKESNNDELTANLSNSTHKSTQSVKIKANLNLSNAYTSDNLNIKTKSIDSIEHLSYCSLAEEKTSHRNPATADEEEEYEDVKIKTKQKKSLQSPTFFLKSIKHYWKSIVCKKETLDHLSGKISHLHYDTENLNEKELDKKKLNASDSQTGNSSTTEVVNYSQPLETTTTPGTNINADFITDDIYITNYKSKHFRGLLFERSAGLFPWDCTQIEARAYLMSAFPGTRLAQWLKEWKHPSHYPTLIAIGRTAEGDIVCSRLHGSTASLDNALYWLNNVTLAHFNNYRQFTKPSCPEKTEKFLLASTAASSPPPSSEAASLLLQANDTCLLNSTIHLTIPPTNGNDDGETIQCKVYNKIPKSSHHQPPELNHSPIAMDERSSQIDGIRVTRNINSRQLKSTIIQDDFKYRIIKSPKVDEEALSSLFELPQEVEPNRPRERYKIIQKSFKSVTEKMNKPEKYDALLKTNRTMIIRPKLSKQLSRYQKSHFNAKYRMYKTNDPYVNKLQLMKTKETISKDGYDRRLQRLHRHANDDDENVDDDIESADDNNDIDSCDNDDEHANDFVNVNMNENDQSSLTDSSSSSSSSRSIKQTSNSQLEDYLKSCIIKGSHSIQELFKLSDIFEYGQNVEEVKNDQSVNQNDDAFYHSYNSSSSGWGKELKPVEFLQVFNQQYVCDLPCNPSFLIGRLSTAVIRSFDLNKFKQIRPLLIYLHDSQADGAMHFVSNVLCSKRFTGRLYENNLLIWPLDLTNMTKKNIIQQLEKQKRQSHSSASYHHPCPHPPPPPHSSLQKRNSHDILTSSVVRQSKSDVISRFQASNKHHHLQRQQQRHSHYHHSDGYTPRDDDYSLKSSVTTSRTEFYTGQYESSLDNENNVNKSTTQNNNKNQFGKNKVSINAQRLFSCFEKHPAGETFKQIVKISALPVLVNLKWHNEHFLVSHLLLPSSTTKESLNWLGSVLKLYANEVSLC